MTLLTLLCLLGALPGDLETPADRDRLVLEGRAEWFMPLPWSRLETRFPTGTHLAVVVRLIAEGGPAWFRGPVGGLPVGNPGLVPSPTSQGPDPWASHDWNGIELLDWGAIRVVPAREGRPTGLHQVVSVPALTDQSLSVWAAALGPGDRARLEILPATDQEAITASWDGTARTPLATEHARGSPIDAALGGTALRLSSGASAALWVADPGARAIRVGCMARSDSGRAVLTLSVVGDSGTLLASRTLPLRPRWERVPSLVAWVPAGTQGVTVSWSAGQAPLSIDNLDVGPPQSDFAAAAAEPSGDPIVLGGPLRIAIDQAVTGPAAQARARELARAMAWGAPLEGELVEWSVRADATLPTQSYRGSAAADGGLPELLVADRLAAAYALSDLSAFVARRGDSAVLMAAALEGRPVVTWRGAMLTDPPQTELRDLVAALSAARFTHVLLSTGDWGRLGGPEVMRRLAALRGEISRQDMTLVPMLRVWGDSLLRDRPMLAATSEALETLRLAELRPTLLSRANTVLTDRKRVTVTSDDGRVTYVEGEDYTLVHGVTAFTDSGYRAAGTPWGVARAARGRIRDGQTVRVTHHYVSETGSLVVAPDMGEPEVRAALMDDLRRLYLLLGPTMVLLDLGPLSAEASGSDVIATVRELAQECARDLPGLQLVVPTEVVLGPGASTESNLRLLPLTCAILMRGDDRALLARMRTRGHSVLVSVAGEPQIVARAAARSGQWSADGEAIIGLAVELPEVSPPMAEYEAGRAAWLGAVVSPPARPLPR